MSHTFSEKCPVFRGESETIRCIGVKFSEITETVMLFQYSEFLVLLASSDSDEHMLMGQNSPIEISRDPFY